MRRSAALLLALGCSPAAAAPRVGVPTPDRSDLLAPPPGAEPADPASPATTTQAALELERDLRADEPPRLDLPPRSPGAESGSQFLHRIAGLGRGAIDDEVVRAVHAGNVPDYQRTLVPITVRDAGGREATLHVMSDYLAIGSDEDFIRMPMTPAAAQKICDQLGTTLPTPKLVDTIFDQAEARLPPSYIDGGPTDDDISDFIVHQEKLEQRRAKAGFELGRLLAGHKKDIVLTVRLEERDDRVAIYGWHKKDGTPIQPLSCKHSCRYADYSHGVRLVDERMTIAGRPHRVSDVLADPDLSTLLSDEGPLRITTYPRELPPYEGPPKAAKKKARKRKS
jgi:hypothetical protein